MSDLMLNFSKLLLLVYILLKPFYLFNSGGIQVADAFLLAAFLSYFINSWLHKPNRADFFKILSKHRLFIIFVLFSFLVNFAYFLYFPEKKFLMSTLYFVFNLLAIIIFSSYLRDPQFLRRLGGIFKINLLIQLILWIANLGRYYSADRYMGTFNDPNQFGYYIFLSFMFIFIIDIIEKRRWTLVYYFLSIILVIASSSTGILLGFSVFSVLVALYLIRLRWRTSYDAFKSIVYTFAALVVAIAPVVLFYQLYGSNSSNLTDSWSSLSEGTIFERVEGKTKKAEGEASMSLWEDRGLDTIFKYPHYLVLGSGEGAYDRFVGVTNNYGNEIHSTFPSILFYYGFIPFVVLILWFRRQLIGVPAVYWAVVVAVVATSFILLNQRQALFWVLFILIGIYGPLFPRIVNKDTSKRGLSDA